jgi:1-aminocyclopropane-1-carboxylate deaminase/D-cysteine desulfhydrase-like pyridoxal-dependent ACC family enzyme
MSDPRTCALFERFPALAERVPWRRLGRWPTPVTTVPASLPCADLSIKRDDLSGEAYGGNKVRKLEFLLAEALAQGCGGVITFGTAGSNHALATAVYARQLGLVCYSMLTRQAVTSAARRNLLTAHHYGARLMGFDSEEAAAGAARDLLRRADGARLMLIPGGGSSPLGCLGFVSAALELKEQLDAAALPPPDVIYLPLGTTGTLAGLQLGLRIAGLDSRVTAVRVVREDVAEPARWRRLYRQAGELLAPEVPIIDGLPDADAGLEVRHEFFGPGYARYTPEAMAACRRARELAGIGLEGTYSGKAFACLLADLDDRRLDGRRVLFWDTYSSSPPPPDIAAIDFHELPGFFHYYFEHPVQPLDPAADAGAEDRPA